MIELLKAGLAALWKDDSELNRNMLHDLFMENGFPLIAADTKWLRFYSFKKPIKRQRHQNAIIELYSERDDVLRGFLICLSVITDTIIFKSNVFKLFETEECVKDLSDECTKFNREYGVNYD